MKQILYLAFIAILLCITSAIRPVKASTVNGQDGDGIPIILIGQHPFEESGGPRSTSTIEAYWDSTIHSVNVYLNNAGNEVTVDIVNNTTGESFQCLVSGNGWDCIPVTGLPGPRVITFTLETGTIYYGMFIK